MSQGYSNRNKLPKRSDRTSDDDNDETDKDLTNSKKKEDMRLTLISLLSNLSIC